MMLRRAQHLEGVSRVHHLTVAARPIDWTAGRLNLAIIRSPPWQWAITVSQDRRGAFGWKLNNAEGLGGGRR
jgi:hypothetical protein